MNKRNIVLIIIGTFLAGTIMSCDSKQKNKPAEPTEQEQVKNKNSKEEGKVMELNTSVFKQRVVNYEKHPDNWVFEGDKPAIVDFYATWCGPCKMVAPIMEELAVKYKGKVDFYKLDVDKEAEVAQTFGIQSIPTILFIPKQGQPTMTAGAMGIKDLDSAIQKLLLK